MEEELMAHLTARKEYGSLVDRLNRFPQGAPPSRLLFEILALLFSEKEAELVAKLPLRPFTARRAARVWGIGLAEAEAALQGLAAKALLVDLRMNGRTYYVLPPPMAGFFEFALMRVRDDIDQKLLSELYEQYISVEEDFIKALFVTGKTQFGRVLVQESVLTSEEALHVLDFERASAIIESATDIGIGLCYCRHKRHHQGKSCSADLDICMTFNHAAASLIRHNVVRRVDKSECLELLHRAFEQNLAQFGENVQRGVSFICNCCGCCCEAMLAARRFGLLRPVHTSGFIARVETACTGCGRCLPACPIKVMTLQTQGEQGRGEKRALIDDDLCLGCGVCARNCPRGAIVMHRRKEKIITPVNGTHRAVLMAIERGKLQNLLFDNRVLWSHRALAAVFGVILNLSPVKRALAGEQIGSRYLGAICEKYGI
jgi:ferredoxin